MNFIPSRNIISFLIISVGLVAGIMFAFRERETRVVLNVASNLIAGNKINLPENKDWQLELEKMPSAQIDQIELEPIEQKTLTDSVSENLMTNYLVLRQNGEYNQTNIQDLVDNTLNYIEKTGKPNNNENIQLNTFADRGKSSIIEYGERLGNLMKKHKPKDAKNEIRILENIATTKNEKQIDELRQISIRYTQIAEDLIAMPIPKSFARAHLDIIKSIKGLGAGTTEMTYVLNDPFRALSGMQTYQESGIIFAEAMKAIVGYITANKISYKQGSGGYYLLYGI